MSIQGGAKWIALAPFEIPALVRQGNLACQCTANHEMCELNSLNLAPFQSLNPVNDHQMALTGSALLYSWFQQCTLWGGLIMKIMIWKFPRCSQIPPPFDIETPPESGEIWPPSLRCGVPAVWKTKCKTGEPRCGRHHHAPLLGAARGSQLPHSGRPGKDKEWGPAKEI